MSSQNVSLVRALLEAVAEGGLDAGREYLHPDFEMVQLPLHPEAGTYRGGAAVAESIEDWTESFDEFGWDTEELIDAGDQVVAVIRERGKARGAGVALDHPYGALYTVRDGKVARLQWFHDRQEALDAAGPGEAAPTSRSRPRGSRELP